MKKTRLALFLRNPLHGLHSVQTGVYIHNPMNRTNMTVISYNVIN
jgi:hypothetical protein